MDRVDYLDTFIAAADCTRARGTVPPSDATRCSPENSSPFDDRPPGMRRRPADVAGAGTMVGMLAYVISEVQILDDSQGQRYRELAAASIARHGGRYIVRERARGT